MSASLDWLPVVAVGLLLIMALAGALWNCWEWFDEHAENIVMLGFYVLILAISAGALFLLASFVRWAWYY